MQQALVINHQVRQRFTDNIKSTAAAKIHDHEEKEMTNVFIYHVAQVAYIHTGLHF